MSFLDTHRNAKRLIAMSYARLNLTVGTSGERHVGRANALFERAGLVLSRVSTLVWMIAARIARLPQWWRCSARIGQSATRCRVLPNSYRFAWTVFARICLESAFRIAVRIFRSATRQETTMDSPQPKSARGACIGARSCFAPACLARLFCLFHKPLPFPLHWNGRQRRSYPAGGQTSASTLNAETATLRVP